MWLTKNVANILNKNRINTASNIGEVTNTSQNNASVMSDFEHRDIKIISPQGVCYKPKVGEHCFTISSDNTELYLGSQMPDKNLNEGDLLLFSGSTAKILIKSNGNIEITGNVIINGTPI